MLDKYNDWYKIKTISGRIGWVYKELININNDISSRSNDVARDDSSEKLSLAQSIIKYSKNLLGIKYVYGGMSNKGFDCSGFVKYVFGKFGINVDRVAAEQAQNGNSVSKGNLSTGDLVFFDTDGGRNYINHVGIYIENGDFIHASSGSVSHKVVISNLNSGFYSTYYMTARRVINP